GITRKQYRKTLFLGMRHPAPTFNPMTDAAKKVAIRLPVASNMLTAYLDISSIGASKKPNFDLTGC
ncbi:MAG: hypothetical protein KGN35_11565, partial [Betaproteobacteria bacterium]|nr:hypothetical protein [Betaproteobacteria bacterium]